MSREEIIARLGENIDKAVLVKFTEDARDPLTPVRNRWPGPDDEAQMRFGRVRRMKIVSVDDEGFVNQVNGEIFWTRFDDVEDVEPLDQ